MVARHIPTVMGIFAFLMAYRFLGVEEWLIGSSLKEKIQDNYDFIIVGGGTSGAVLASRLTEDKDRKVLLLEAGLDIRFNQDVSVPIMADRLHGGPLDWNYVTVPQKQACKSHNDNTAIWTAGKGLGGTSNVNYMQYQRGGRHDYDEWVSNGATGWGYKDVLPYFIISEDQHNGEYLRTIFHGFGGRLGVSETSWSPLGKMLPIAFKELNVKKRDLNGRNQFGFMTTQATIRRGARCGSYHCFLTRAMHRDNLHIMTDAVVTKIIFDKKTAVAVQISHAGKEITVRANKEIILAAGTVGTAKLLLLSGVGPRAHLQQHKIPIVADLPVGENLQDHVMAHPIEFYTPYYFSITAARAENFLSSWAYSIFGTGSKGSPRFREAVAHIRTKFQAHYKYPLVALHFLGNVGVYEAERMNVKEKSWDALYAKPPSLEGFSIIPILMHPRSKGTVRLKSANPEDPALINPNYLEDPVDVKLLIEAIKYVRNKFANTEKLKEWDFTINRNQLPECAKYGNFTDSYNECAIRHITLSGNSPSGTCRIGAAGDPTAVTDPHLRIRGLKKIRIADASIIPIAITGNTYATQVMIAERLADDLRERNSVLPIQEYFKHLLAVKHEKIRDEDHDHEVKNGKEKEKEKK